ncbi:MAG: hypothetical protein AAGF26_06795 [Cyanobacteria bacterium P01_G01_bin.49]
MKPLNDNFIDENESNALDLDHRTVTQRHGRHAWKYNYPRHLRQHTSNVSREYRQTIRHHYSPTRISDGTSLPIMSTDYEDELCPIFLKSSLVLTTNEGSQIHLANICNNLEQRLKIARNKGDKFLVSLLEKEYQDLNQMSINFS